MDMRCPTRYSQTKFHIDGTCITEHAGEETRW